MTAIALGIDRVTAEVMDTLESRGVSALLLKGPSIATWLYGDGAARPYGDTDLLVAPAHEQAAEEALASIGFVASPGTGRPDPGIARNHIWNRGPETVELHVSLTGIGAEPQRVWEELSSDPRTLPVAGREVPTLSRAAQLLHLALHAAQHGRAEAKPVEDLRRAIEATEDADWVPAAELARRLRATSALAAGLQLARGGDELASHLAIGPVSEREVALRAASAPVLAFGMERLARERGFRARAARLLRAAFPTPAFLRWWTPLARRGPLGLAAAYGLRLGYLVAQVPGAVLAMRRAHSASRRPPR